MDRKAGCVESAGKACKKLANRGNKAVATSRPKILPLGCNKCQAAAMRGAGAAAGVVA